MIQTSDTYLTFNKYVKELLEKGESILVDKNMVLIDHICRAINKVSADQKKIKGLTDICSVCFDKNVEMFFPTCGHVCVCYECFIQTSKNS